MWQYHAEHLAEFHCLMPDLPGFGRSQDEPWVSLEDTADALATLIAAKASGGRAHVVGLSLGGATALLLLSRHPERVDHLIVDGAAPKVGSVTALKLGIQLAAPLLHFDPVIRLLAGTMGIPAEAYPAFRDDLRAASPAAFSRAFGQALELTCPANLARLRNPTLLVAGGSEMHSTLDGLRRLEAKMPQAYATVVPGYGHGWVGAATALHCQMVRAWVNDTPLPAALRPLPPDAEPIPAQSF
jgi:pimeloyl-ACP methyl ester carboxylesterase